MAFVPLRTGNESIDRIQDRISDATNQLQASQQQIAASIPTQGEAISTTLSRIVPLGCPGVTIHDTLSDVRLLLPSAISAKGATIQFNFVSSTGAFTATIVPGNVGGRRQTISGASTKVLNVGDKATLTSDGKDWQVQ